MVWSEVTICLCSWSFLLDCQRHPSKSLCNSCFVSGLNDSSMMLFFSSCRYEYRVEMIHHASPDSSKNIVREFGEL